VVLVTNGGASFINEKAGRHRYLAENTAM